MSALPRLHLGAYRSLDGREEPRARAAVGAGRAQAGARRIGGAFEKLACRGLVAGAVMAERSCAVGRCCTLSQTWRPSVRAAPPHARARETSSPIRRRLIARSRASTAQRRGRRTLVGTQCAAKCAAGTRDASRSWMPTAEENRATYAHFCPEVLVLGELDAIDELVDPAFVSHSPFPGKAPRAPRIQAGLRAVPRGVWEPRCDRSRTACDDANARRCQRRSFPPGDTRPAVQRCAADTLKSHV
jgi:hypothetical protein